MRKYIVAGNWKMNGSKQSVDTLLNDIKAGASEISEVEWIVFPSYPFLVQTEQQLQGSNVAWGAQNLSDQDAGAFTGEVAANMLQDFGCNYVLVGHSERRAIYGESDELVAAKFAKAIAAGLTPILCVGETLAEREQGITAQVVNRQMQAVLALENGVRNLQQAIIAYEPVWAIGTGVTASPEQAQEVHQLIRAQVANLDSEIAAKVQILYGGSVKPNNANEIFAMPDIDGGLIGGASLKANDFLEIGRSCNR